jgi:hypothetical protein
MAWDADRSAFAAPRRQVGAPAAYAGKPACAPRQRSLRFLPDAVRAAPGKRAGRIAAPAPQSRGLRRAALAAPPAWHTGGAAPAAQVGQRASTLQRRVVGSLPRSAAQSPPQDRSSGAAATMALRLDMTWRASAPVAGRAEHRDDEPRRPGTGAAAVRPDLPRPHPAAGAGAPPPEPRVRPPAGMTLDPAVAERLVEDVLRRAEQRMRIERERRGL